MDDLISRQDAIDALKHNQDVYSHNFHDDPINKYTAAIIAADIDSLVNLPSAEPERKRGKWILSDIQNPEDVRNGNYVYICSNCSHSDIHAKTTVVPFCWHCGADMRGEQDG